MTSTGVRRLDFFDFMHYDTANSCFDNTTTVVWTAPGSASYQAWDSVFGGAEELGSNYIIPQAVAGAPTYLRCVEAVIAGRSVMLDWGMKYNGATLDAGIYFLSSTATLGVNCYRVKQLTTTVVIERLDGSGVVQWSDYWSYTPGSNWNYYRLHFWPEDLDFGDGSIVSNAGSFLLEAGESYGTMAFRVPNGTAIDPSPRTAGQYFGIYQGGGSRPSVTLFILGECWYPLRKLLKVEQNLKGSSIMHMVTVRGEYQEWTTWPINSFIQVMAYSVDEDEVYTAYMDFLGQLLLQQEAPTGQSPGDNDNKVYLMAKGLGDALSFHNDPATLTGKLTSCLNDFLEVAGGNHWAGFTKTFGAGSNKFNKSVNRNFADAGQVDVINRMWKGHTLEDVVRDIALAEDFYFYVTPEGAFKFTNYWRDMTSIVIDTGDGSSRLMWYRAVPEDLTQMINEAHNYRSGSTKVAGTTPDTTSQGKYGLRNRTMKRLFNKQVANNEEAQAIADTLVARNSQAFSHIDLYFLTWGMMLRPGDIVSLSMPQLRIGGDWETAHASWVPETWAVLEKNWDSQNAIVHIRVGPTRDIGAGQYVGRQDSFDRAKGMIVNTYIQAIRSGKSALD